MAEEPTDQPTPEQPEPETSQSAQSAQSAEAAGPPSKDSCNLAMLAHLLGIVTGFLGALIIWLIKKEEDTFIDDQGKEALNFQIMLLIVYAVLTAGSCITFGLSSFLIPVIWVASIVFMVLAAVEASKGNKYRYPVCLRLIK